MYDNIQLIAKVFIMNLQDETFQRQDAPKILIFVDTAAIRVQGTGAYFVRAGQTQTGALQRLRLAKFASGQLPVTTVSTTSRIRTTPSESAWLVYRRPVLTTPIYIIFFDFVIVVGLTFAQVPPFSPPRVVAASVLSARCLYIRGAHSNLARSVVASVSRDSTTLRTGMTSQTRR